jgi:hypothetical protein
MPETVSHEGDRAPFSGSASDIQDDATAAVQTTGKDRCQGALTGRTCILCSDIQILCKSVFMCGLL